jgi:hypothetical protein
MTLRVMKQKMRRVMKWRKMKKQDFQEEMDLQKTGTDKTQECTTLRHEELQLENHELERWGDVG